MKLIKTFVAALLLSSSAHAADSWHIGMNNLFIQDYLLDQGVGCATGLTCPTRQDIPLSSISYVLNIWATSTTGHMGTYREIVGMNWVAPTCASSTCSDNANWSKIDAVLDVYKGYGLHLILTLGNPVPAWADSYASNKNGQCFMPTVADTTDWTTLKNNMSWAIGNYYNHYAGLSADRKSWLESNVIIESWNELDAPQSNTTNCDDSSLATPARNYDLTGGINWVIVTWYGLTVNQAMASLGGVYSGATTPQFTTETQLFQYYIANYYAAGGFGAPNIHAYVGGDQGSESNIQSILASYVSAACTGAGTSNCANLILGETGWAQRVTGVCQVGSNGYGLSLDDSIRNNIYKDFAAASNIGGAVNILTYWDSIQYPTSAGRACYGTLGIINQDSSSQTPAINLFNWLETH